MYNAEFEHPVIFRRAHFHVGITRKTLTDSYPVHIRSSGQFVPPHGTAGDIVEVRDVSPHRHLQEMVILQLHHQRKRDEGDRNCVLDDDKHLRKNHLGLPTLFPFDDGHRIVPEGHPGRHQAGNRADHQGQQDICS